MIDRCGVCPSRKGESSKFHFEIVILLPSNKRVPKIVSRLSTFRTRERIFDHRTETASEVANPDPSFWLPISYYQVEVGTIRIPFRRRWSDSIRSISPSLVSAFSNSLIIRPIRMIYYGRPKMLPGEIVSSQNT